MSKNQKPNVALEKHQSVTIFIHLLKTGMNHLSALIYYTQKNKNHSSTETTMIVVPLMEQLSFDQTPHCCLYTCISLLAEEKVSPTFIKLMDIKVQ